MLDIWAFYYKSRYVFKELTASQTRECFSIESELFGA